MEARIIRENQTYAVIKEVRTKPVFFWPDSPINLTPLTRFSDLSRTFVFCHTDGSVNDRGTLEKLLYGEFAEHLQRSGVWLDLDPNILKQSVGLSDAFTIQFNRTVRVHGTAYAERPLRVVFFKGASSDVYRNVFQNDGVPPKFLCLKSAIHDAAAGWPNEALREIIMRTGERHPKYLVGESAGEYSPYSRPWLRYRSWGANTVVYSKERVSLEQGQHHHEDHEEPANLFFQPLPLMPDNLHEDTDAIHVTMEQYRRFQWPAQIRSIFLETEENSAFEEVRREDSRVRSLQLTGRSMSEALLVLLNGCGFARVHVIHCGRLGWEDEGVGLNYWRTKCREFQLTVHCENQNELCSLLGFAEPA